MPASVAPLIAASAGEAYRTAVVIEMHSRYALTTEHTESTDKISKWKLVINHFKFDLAIVQFSISTSVCSVVNAIDDAIESASE